MIFLYFFLKLRFVGHTCIGYIRLVSAPGGGWGYVGSKLVLHTPPGGGVRRWPPAGMEGILSSPGCGGGGAPAFTSVSE